MEYETRQYFTENECDDVKGTIVIGVTDECYLLAEKWLNGNEDGSDRWMRYNAPKDSVHARVESGAIEPKAKLSEKQLNQVKSLVA